MVQPWIPALGLDLSHSLNLPSLTFLHPQMWPVPLSVDLFFPLPGIVSLL